MKKLFISQPMAGKTKEEILEARAAAIEKAKAALNEEVEVIESYNSNYPEDTKPLWLLGDALKKLAYADVAYFCKNWKNYRGCCTEFEACSRYGIKVIEEPGSEI